MRKTAQASLQTCKSKRAFSSNVLYTGVTHMQSIGMHKAPFELHGWANVVS